MTKALAETDPGRGLLRFFLRLPILLYQLRLGWLLDNRFLLLRHTGRKSGLPRETVLEVVRYDKLNNTYIVASGWGEGSQWYKNVIHNPAVEVEAGNRRMKAVAERLSPEEAAAELGAYAQKHPYAFRAIGNRLLGWKLEGKKEEIKELAEKVPIIAFHCQR